VRAWKSCCIGSAVVVAISAHMGNVQEHDGGLPQEPE
jgi:hypothetical protein